MAINTETAIRWMTDRKGRVTYSMNQRTGPSSYDCSSAICYALMSAGASHIRAVTTESAHAWLLANGYALISENQDWDTERGDVIIWGRKGQSIGAGGHIMLALDADNVIHCTYAVNGITVNNYNQLYSWQGGAMGGPYVYVYRLVNGKSLAPAKPTTTQAIVPSVEQGNLELLAGQTMAGMYGSGDARKARLGKRYAAVQAIINERLKAINYQQAHQRLADEVMKGNLGTGEERKKNLGTYYQAVQNIINKR
ncbi:peptidoglycan amidohydrolase family protein [Streptococcus sp. B01]|uniref:peptidoglycan amidohydrolase family protein n=1 Tax=Streptococcus sp. B01 TaxID=2928734 RepID=UPI00211AA577|nr:peptidoglycan amidohydrolase family protein [Streptococcus sp. B01]MCQ9212836.1 NlpC/P60 family protein [Streptococcus sp. B01]